MKILLICPFFYPATSFGGPVTNLLEIAKRLSEKGRQVTVYSSDAFDENTNMNEKEKKINENLTVYYFKNWSRVLGFFVTWGMIGALLKNSKEFDIVHVHSTRHFQDLICYFVMSILKKPYIITCHGAVIPMGKAKKFKKFFDLIVGKKILRKAEKIITISPNQRNECQKMGVKDERIVDIPFGLFTGTPQKKGTFKEKLKLKNEDKIILYLGRIRWSKGIDVLIKAFKKIKEQNAHLVVAGPDFGQLEDCKKMVDDFGITPRVHFIGPVNSQERDELFADSYIFVIPSLYEAFGTAALEAAAAGLPVIISDSCGYSKEFEKSKAGIEVKTSNIEEHANAITKILDSPDEAKKMSQNALEFAKLFDWEKAISSHIALYEEIQKKN